MSSPGKARALRKVSSLVLNTPSPSRARKPIRREPSEIVPDSEDERVMERDGLQAEPQGSGVIEILSSDEEDNRLQVYPRLPLGAGRIQDEGRASGKDKTLGHRSTSKDPFSTAIPGAWPGEPSAGSPPGGSTDIDLTPRSRYLARLPAQDDPSPLPKPASSTTANRRASRRISVEECTIVISDSEPETGSSLPPPLRGPVSGSGEDDSATSTKGAGKRGKGKERQTTLGPIAKSQKPLPLWADDSENEGDSGAEQSENDSDHVEMFIPSAPLTAPKPIRSSKKEQNTVDLLPTPLSAGSLALPGPSNSSPTKSSTRSSTSPSKGKARAPHPLSAKALAEAKHRRLDDYARTLFDELNRTVFHGLIPADTPLIWNKRMLCTAGKAMWHRSGGRDWMGIQLAPKVLDCEERIRSTLPHEMCHLATWLEHGRHVKSHGKEFLAWGATVMRSRPDIIVNTKHDYEINYKYTWKCDRCEQIVGRHTKSLDTEKKMCACHGRLVPQFTTRAPRTRKEKVAQMAKSPQGSPRPALMNTPSPSPSIEPEVICISSGSDSGQDEVEDSDDLGDIVKALKEVAIGRQI